MFDRPLAIGEKTRWIAVIAGLLILAAIGIREAGAIEQGRSEQSPTAQIKGTVDRTIEALSDPALKGNGNKKHRHQKARAVIVPRFDFN